MTVVLDASGALAVALGSDSKDAVLAVLNAEPDVVAPDLFTAEVTSGLWKYVVTHKISMEAASQGYRTAVELVGQYYAISDLAEEVLHEASIRRHAVYDVYYAVLARRENAAILTFDRRLKELCRAMGVPLAL